MGCGFRVLGLGFSLNSLKRGSGLHRGLLSGAFRGDTGV